MDSVRRLDHVDALRVIACLSVLLVHVVAGTAPMPFDDIRINAVGQFLHYGRHVFFFVSAFVLTFVYLRRYESTDATAGGQAFDATKFRARRLRLIGVPYVIWTIAYMLLQHFTYANYMSLGDAPQRVVTALANGDGYFHLYFLLVTLQFGVIFPAFIWLLRRTQGYHIWLFTGSLVLQLATVAVYYEWDRMPGNGYQPIIGEASLLAYQLWFVAGGLAALHYERFHGWIMRNTAWIVLASVVAVGLSQAVYWQAVEAGTMPFKAAFSLQPITVIWSLVALLLLYRLGVALMSTRFGWLTDTIRQVSVLSFAIYLVHPAFLFAQQFYGVPTWRLDVVPQLLYTAAMVVGVAALSIAIGAVLHRTPWSLALIGRPRHRRALAAHPTRLADSGAADGPVAQASPQHQPRSDAVSTPGVASSS